jgi:hypothetical protein
MPWSHGKRKEILIMNQRIQNLIRLADVHILPDDSEYGHCIIGLEKFAMLLVQSCIEQAHEVADLRNATEDMIYGADLAAAKIAKYFGMNDERSNS